MPRLSSPGSEIPHRRGISTKANASVELEAVRLDALRSYQVLDTNRERACNDMTAVIADICQMPIALISLIAADRQRFK